MLEYLRQEYHQFVDVGCFIPHARDACCEQQCRQAAAARGVALEDSEQGVDADGYHGEGEHVESDARPACRHRGGVVAGEICQSESGLLERHPEEDHDGEDQAQSHDTFLGLLRSEFDHLFFFCRFLAFAHVDVLERPAEAEVDGY